MAILSGILVLAKTDDTTDEDNKKIFGAFVRLKTKSGTYENAFFSYDKKDRDRMFATMKRFRSVDTEDRLEWKLVK